MAADPRIWLSVTLVTLLRPNIKGHGSYGDDHGSYGPIRLKGKLFCCKSAQTSPVTELAFCLPAGRSQGREGVTPQGVGGRCSGKSERRNVIRLWLDLLGSPSARLVLSRFLVVASSAQRPKVLWCVRHYLTSCQQLLTAQRPMVRDVGMPTTQHTPWIRVQVSHSLSLPPNVITALAGRSSLLLPLFLVFSARTTIREFAATRLSTWLLGHSGHGCSKGLHADGSGDVAPAKGGGGERLGAYLLVAGG